MRRHVVERPRELARGHAVVADVLEAPLRRAELGGVRGLDADVAVGVEHADGDVVGGRELEQLVARVDPVAADSGHDLLLQAVLDPGGVVADVVVEVADHLALGEERDDEPEREQDREGEDRRRDRQPPADRELVEAGDDPRLHGALRT